MDRVGSTQSIKANIPLHHINFDRFTKGLQYFGGNYDEVFYNIPLLVHAGQVLFPPAGGIM
jgi:hypothetical protein